jgi:hypothetical protein
MHQWSSQLSDNHLSLPTMLRVAENQTSRTVEKRVSVSSTDEESV